MKIIPFEQKLAINTPKGRVLSQPGDFAAELKKAETPSQSGLRAIFSENLKASQKVSPEDLGAAGELVNALIGQIQKAAPLELRKVHDLDGVLYYYQV
jgi:hypothetical protein